MEKKHARLLGMLICIVLRSKSLIKPIQARIDVRRKGNEATQRFLKNNLAQLLANRHYVKAYDKVKILILCFPLDYSLCSLALTTGFKFNQVLIRLRFVYLGQNITRKSN